MLGGCGREKEDWVTTSRGIRASQGTFSSYFSCLGLDIKPQLKNICTLQPHYNTPHYNAVFTITRPCYGSQINYLTICL